MNNFSSSSLIWFLTWIDSLFSFFFFYVDFFHQ
jgi:hypothetical protein